MNIKKSFELQNHAKKRIPGLCQLLSKRPDQFSWGVWPGYFSKAKGVNVWDLDGNEYIDMSIGGIGATVLGYADEDINNAVKAAIDNGVATSLNCPEEVELADLLCELHPWASMCRFTRTGGESITIAIRIARAFSGKDKVAFCGYHGWHDWYLAANIGTENALGEHLLPGLNPNGVPKKLAGTSLPFRYNQIEELEHIVEEHGDSLGVIVMESIRSDEPHDGFLQKVKALAEKVGAVLIIDEISAGFRMNTGGAHLLYDLVPDIAVFSKAIGNGFSIGAVIGKSDVMSAAQNTFISSTNWTERVGFAAAIATIKKFRDNNVGDHLVKIGGAIQAGWEEISKKSGVKISVGGIKPMSHFGFVEGDSLSFKAYFVQEMLKRGFLASTAFYAMYAHTMDDVNKYLAAAASVFADIAKMKQNNTDIKDALEGEASVAGFKRLT